MPKQQPPSRIPTNKDISPAYGTDHEGLDEAHARKTFHGKTLEEAGLLFRENALFYQEDLLFMGPAGFRYYIHAYLNYLESPHATHDSDAVNCFVSLLEYRLEKQAKEILPVAAQLTQTCQHILNHYDRFDITADIYGDLRPQLEILIKRLGSLE